MGMELINRAVLLNDINHLKDTRWYQSEQRQFEKFIRNNTIKVIREALVEHSEVIDARPNSYMKWLRVKPDNEGKTDTYYCTYCWDTVTMKRKVKSCKFNFCPNCGSINIEGDKYEDS